MRITLPISSHRLNFLNNVLIKQLTGVKCFDKDYSKFDMDGQIVVVFDDEQIDGTDLVMMEMTKDKFAEDYARGLTHLALECAVLLHAPRR